MNREMILNAANQILKLYLWVMFLSLASTGILVIVTILTDAPH